MHNIKKKIMEMREAGRLRWKLKGNCWPSRAQAYPKTKGSGGGGGRTEFLRKEEREEWCFRKKYSH